MISILLAAAMAGSLGFIIGYRKGYKPWKEHCMSLKLWQENVTYGIYDRNGIPVDEIKLEFRKVKKEVK